MPEVESPAALLPECKTNPRKGSKKVRGVFEKMPGVWYIQYFDVDGRRRREKAGSKGNVIDLYRKRKNEVLTGKKLPEKLRARVVRFAELAEDAEAYCKANNQGQQFDFTASVGSKKNSATVRRKSQLRTCGSGSVSRTGRTPPSTVTKPCCRSFTVSGWRIARQSPIQPGF